MRTPTTLLMLLALVLTGRGALLDRCFCEEMRQHPHPYLRREEVVLIGVAVSGPPRPVSAANHMGGCTLEYAASFARCSSSDTGACRACGFTEPDKVRFGVAATLPLHAISTTSASVIAGITCADRLSPGNVYNLPGVCRGDIFYMDPCPTDFRSRTSESPNVPWDQSAPAPSCAPPPPWQAPRDVTGGPRSRLAPSSYRAWAPPHPPPRGLV